MKSDQLLTFSADDSIRQWDLCSGKLRLYKGHHPHAISVLFLGKELQAMQGVQSGGHRPERIRASACGTFALSTDGSHGWSWNPSSQASLWNLKTGQRVAQLHGHDVGTLAMLAFAADSSLCATAGKAKTVCVYETTEGKLVNVLRGHDAPIVTGCFLSTKAILTAGGDELKLWMLDQQSSTPPIAYVPNNSPFAAKEGPWTVQFTNRYIVGTHNVSGDMLGVWDRGTGEQLPPLSGAWNARTTSRGLAALPDGDHVYVGLNGSSSLGIPCVELTGRGTATRIELPPTNSHFHGNTMALALNGSKLAVTTLDYSTIVMDVSSGAMTVYQKHQHQHVWDVMLSHDGGLVAASDGSKTIHVFVSSSAAARCTLSQENVVAFGFNANNRLLLVLKNKTVVEYDVTGTAAKLKATHEQFVAADDVAGVFVGARSKLWLALRQGTSVALVDVDGFQVGRRASTWRRQELTAVLRWWRSLTASAAACRS